MKALQGYFVPCEFPECIAKTRPGSVILSWFARKGFTPGEIGRLLALIDEIDHNGLKEILEPLRRRDE